MMLSRPIKTSLRSLIAIIIGLITYQLIDKRFSYWILFTVVVLLPSTTGATTQKAVRRVVGTLLGVLVGLLIMVLIPGNLYWYAFLLLLSLTLTTYFIKITYATGMFFAGMMVVIGLTAFLAKGNDSLAWSFAVARFVDTAIAAVIVIFVANVFWPERSSDILLRNIAATLTAVEATLRSLLAQCTEALPTTEVSASVQTLYAKIRSLEQGYQEVQNEPNGLLNNSHVIAGLISSFHALKNNLISLQTVMPWVRQAHVGSESIAKIQHFFNQLLAIFPPTVMLMKQKKIGAIEHRAMIADFLTMATDIRAWVEQHQQTSNKADSDIALQQFLINLRDVCIQMQFSLSAIKLLK